MPGRDKTERGCLYKLQVTNFKSYGGHLEIGPFKDFTCVIGPNGSGKSNLMDAVSFVMGANTKDLRGQKVIDFRSHGAGKDDDNTSVTLFYRPASQSMDEDDNEGEIQFTRTILASSASEYRIDGRKATEKDYQTKLKSVGLLVKSRNFLVFQNEVEKVAQKSPMELTELVERISGSEDYKKEYQDLNQEIGEGGAVAISLFRTKELVNKEKKQCKEAVKEADAYQHYCDQLKDSKTTKALFDAFHLERQMETHAKSAVESATSLATATKNCGVLTRKMELKGKEKAAKQKEYAEHESKAEKMEKKIRSIQRGEILPSQTSIDSTTADLRVSEKEIKTSREKIDEVTKTLKTDQTLLTSHEEDLKQEEAADTGGKFELQGNQETEYNRLKLVAEQQNAKAKGAYTSTETAQRSDNDKFDNLDKEFSNLKERLETQQENFKQVGGDKETDSKDVQTLGHQKQKLESDLKDVEVRYQQERGHRKKLEEADEHLRNELSSMQSDDHRKKTEDRSKKHVEKLKATFSGVVGRISDLCKTRQKAYDLAMTVVLENHLESIVVDNLDTVHKCIEHLKEQKWSPMTFLPLDTISAKPPDEKLREAAAQNVKLALDLLEFDEPVTKAMWYVCGNTVVTDTLEQAKALAYNGDPKFRVKVVSKDGSLISKSGIMTGGDASIFTSKLQRWQAADTDKLKEKYQSNAAQLETSKGKVRTLDNEISNLRREKDDVDNKLRSAKERKDDGEGRLKTRKAEIEKMTKQVQEKQKAVQEVQKRIKARADQLDKEQQALSTINDKVFAAFCKENGISSITEYEGGSLAEVRERKQKLNKLSMQVEKLKSKTTKTAKTKQELGATIKTAEESSKACTEKIKMLERKLEDAKVSKQEAMDQKMDIVAKRDESKKETLAIEDDIKKYQVVLKTHSDERDEFTRKSEQSEKKVELCKEDFKALLDQCKLDDLDLPRKGQGKKKKQSVGGEDAMEEDEDDEEEEPDEDEDMGESQEGESQSQVVDLARKELKKINLDYSKLLRDQKRDLSDKEQDKIRKEFSDKQGVISDHLQGMNPNMKASEQLEEIDGRFEVLQAQWKDKRLANEALQVRFETVKKNRCDTFNSCFEHVANVIDELYKELTKDPTSTSSVGGSAYLTLNSQDEPYTSGIKFDTIPPGKRFMGMDSLSGGEKTLAALSLLFAINSYKPAPFIVLDEVDAALDASNVAKVTRFIQSRREEQQCVIISLKEAFYQKADGLVGICRNKESGHSNAFTLDLTLYDDVVA